MKRYPNDGHQDAFPGNGLQPIDIDEAERRFVGRLTRSMEYSAQDADDLEQELWLAMLKAKPNADDCRRSWFSTVARRIQANRVRRSLRRSDREQIYFADRQQANQSTSDGRPQIASALALGKAVAGLSEFKQEVLRLRYDESLSFAEVAEELGIREATARSHHHRALERLRDTLVPGESPSATTAFPLVLFARWRARLAQATGRWSAPALGALCATLVVGAALVGVRYLGAGPEPRPLARELPQATKIADVVGESDAAARGSGRTAASSGPVETQPAESGRSDLQASAGGTKLDVQVLVVDPDGNPVPGAEVSLLRARLGASEPEVLRSDLVAANDGTVTVPRQGRDTWIMAQDASGRRSNARMLDFVHLEPELARLELAPGPHTWSCQVVDASGAPIGGATIYAGRPSLQGVSKESTLSPQSSMTHAAVTTDEAGLANVPRIPALSDRLGYYVKADGYAPKSFHRGASRVELIRSRALFGRVVSNDGTPQEGADVTLALKGTGAVWRSTSRADGQFMFPDAPVGVVDLEVQSGALGAALELELNETVADEIRVPLSSDIMVRGRASKASGSAAGGLRAELLTAWHNEVSLSAQHQFRRRSIKTSLTDSDGEFALMRRHTRGGTLRLVDPDTGEVVGVQRLTASPRMELLASPQAPKVRALAGQYIATEDGAPIARWILAASDWSMAPWLVPVDPTTGRFELQAVESSELWLQPIGGLAGDGASSPLPLHVTRVSVEPTTTDVVLRSRSRRVTIRGFDASGARIEELRVTVVEGTQVHGGHSGEGGVGPVSISKDGEVTLRPVTNGELFVRVLSADRSLIAAILVDAVPAGGTGRQQRDVTLRPAAKQTILLDLPGESSDAAFEPVDLSPRAEVRDAAGRLVFVSILRKGGPGGDGRLLARLAPGPYRLTLHFGAVRTEQFEFEVTSADPTTREMIEAHRLQE